MYGGRRCVGKNTNNCQEKRSPKGLCASPTIFYPIVTAIHACFSGTNEADEALQQIICQAAVGEKEEIREEE